MGSQRSKVPSHLQLPSLFIRSILSFEFYTVALRGVALILFKDNETDDKKDTC